MKIAQVIKQRMDKKGPGSLWSILDFSDLSIQAVAQTLSRMAKQGALTRVRKGIYYYPKKTVLGPSSPSTIDVLSKMASRKKSRNYLGDASAYNNLGLTTQVPAQLVIFGDHPNKSVQIGNQTVIFKHRPMDHLKSANDQTVWILDALRNIKKIPDSTAGDAVDKIIQLIRDDKLDISNLLHFGQKEVPRTRALLGAIAEQCGYRGPNLSKIKKSLNPLTKYKLGVSRSLPTAARWNII
jgi:hypothetical protein